MIPAEAAPAPAGTDTAVVEGSVLQDLPIASIVANRHQPRQSFDDEALGALTASIREVGLLQPVLVRPAEDGHYELIAGERRWRAAHRAGLDRIPALIRTADDVDALEQAVVENLHRADLNALEEAAAYQQLIEEFELTHEQVATRVGKSRVAVTNALRLFQLPSTVQRLVADGELTGGHAKALLGTPDRAFLEHLARRAVAEGLTVRQIEEAVRERGDLEAAASSADADSASTRSDRRGARSGAGRDPGLLELEELLAEFLATRVAIRAAAAGRGKVVIEFADLEDLERIYRQIAAGPPMAVAGSSDSDD